MPRRVREGIASAQVKLNWLTQGYLAGLIDEEIYEVAKESLIVEKATLKQKKDRLQKTRAGFWIEPALGVINALESAPNTHTNKSPEEISKLVQKIGTNRQISGKKK